MSAQRFRVVLTGRVVKGFDPDQVAESLGKTFKQPPEKMLRQLSGVRTPINQEFDQGRAEQVRERILAMGAVCEIEAVKPKLSLELVPHEAPEATAQAAPAAEPETGLRCPKCGHRQAAGERCEGCGVFFSKVLPEAAPAPAPAAPPPPAAAAAAPPRERAPVQNWPVDLGQFVGPNVHYYDEKFNQFRIAGDTWAITWNRSAVGAPWLWAIYRRMYSWAAIMFLSEIIPISRFAWGATANYIYYRHAREKISRIRKAHRGQEEDFVLERIAEAGGVNRIGFVAGLIFAIGLSYTLKQWLIKQEEQTFAEAYSEYVIGDKPVSFSDPRLEEPSIKDSFEKMRRLAYYLEYLRDDPESPATLDGVRGRFGVEDSDLIDAWGNDLLFEQEKNRIRSNGPDGLPLSADDLAYKLEGPGG